MRRVTVIGLILVFAVLPSAYGQVAFKHGTLTLTQGARRVVLQVEVADTPATRAHGLMFRKSLPELSGMLFIFESEGQWGFWMKNTLIPLSIGYFDSKWRLVGMQDMNVAADTEKGPFPIYEPHVAFTYALEVNQCFFKRKGLAPWRWHADGTVVTRGATGVLALTQSAVPPRTTAKMSPTAGAPPTCVGQ